MQTARYRFRFQDLKLLICIQAILCAEELYVSVRTQSVFCSKYFLARVPGFAGVCETMNVLLNFF